MPKTYRAVIFDLDGTLLDTLEDLTASVNHALRRYAGTERSTEEIRSFVGNGVRMLMSRSLPGGAESPCFEEAFAAFREHYAAHCRDRTRPYPGIPELVGELRGRGLLLAVVSNKTDPEVKRLNREYFGGIFPLAVGEREGVRRKPAPDSLFRVLEELGAGREEALYVGDTEVDVQTARNAGVDCVAVTWGFRSPEQLREAGASVLVRSPAELAELLSNSSGA